jgi:hypothetical protein
MAAPAACLRPSGPKGRYATHRASGFVRAQLAGISKAQAAQAACQARGPVGLGPPAAYKP